MYKHAYYLNQSVNAHLNLFDTLDVHSKSYTTMRFRHPEAVTDNYQNTESGL